MITNLVSFSDFMTSFSNLNGYPMDGQYEMLYDALYLSIRNIATVLPYGVGDLLWPVNVGQAIDESIPAIDDFHIEWRPKAKRVVIVFTDEPGQSFTIPTDVANNGGSWNTGDTITEDMLAAAAGSTPELKVYTFTNKPSKNPWGNNGGWESIATASGGKWYLLSTNTALMYDNLMEIIDENACTK